MDMDIITSNLILSFFPNGRVNSVEYFPRIPDPEHRIPAFTLLGCPGDSYLLLVKTESLTFPEPNSKSDCLTAMSPSMISLVTKLREINRRILLTLFNPIAHIFTFLFSWG